MDLLSKVQCTDLGLAVQYVWSAFSLGCFWGVLHPPSVQIYPPISVSEAAAPPIRAMACKADLYSIIITEQLYTYKCTATDCTIVTLWIGGGLETSALKLPPCTPHFKILARTLRMVGVGVALHCMAVRMCMYYVVNRSIYI